MDKILDSNNKDLALFYQDSLTILEIVALLNKEYRPSLSGKRFYTDTQLADKLNVSKRTLQEYRDAGLISFYRLDGKILYSEDDIDDFLKSTYRPKF